MPVPIIATAVPSAMAWINGALIAGGVVYYKEVIRDALGSFFESPAFGGILTKGANAAIKTGLEGKGLDLVFSDITDKAAVGSELMAFAVSLINDKIGADFSDVDWETVDKDEILLRLSRVIRDRINEETGAQLGDLWPVDTARESVGAEVVRQLEDGSAVGLLPQSAIQFADGKVVARLPEYIRAGGVQTPSQIREAAMNRARQKRWREKSKHVWVTR